MTNKKTNFTKSQNALIGLFKLTDCLNSLVVKIGVAIGSQNEKDY